MKTRAVIVGLGQVGIRFDLEPARMSGKDGVWTHFSAYKKLSADFDLVAIVDPKRENWSFALERQPKLACFGSIDDLLSSQIQFDIASICTPDELHLEAAEKLATRARALFIEKPLCSLSELRRGESLVSQFKQQKKSVRINYFKRTESSVATLRSLLGSDPIRHAQCKYSGPFAAVGSHAVDLLAWITPLQELQGSVCHPHSEGDGWSALFSLVGAGSAALLYTGPRHSLIFELEIVTDKNRYRLADNLQRLELFEASPSGRYQGYSEYVAAATSPSLAPSERFISALLELRAELIGSQEPKYESVDCALQTQEWMTKITTHSASPLRLPNR